MAVSSGAPTHMGHHERAHQAVVAAIKELDVPDRQAADALARKLAEVGYDVSTKQIRRWRAGAQPPSGALIALADAFTGGSVDALLDLAGEKPAPLRAWMASVDQAIERLRADLALTRSGK